MPPVPPEDLTELLNELGLATPEQLARLAPRVRALTRGVPEFQGVWIDALLGARRITSFQAEELHRNRGRRLRIGVAVLRERLVGEGFGTWYLARDARGGDPLRVWASPTLGEEPPLNGWLARHDESKIILPEVPLLEARFHEDRLWLLYRAEARGGQKLLSEILWRRGRIPPPTVLSVLRTVATGLRGIHRRGEVHGDLSPWNTWLTQRGNVELTLAGCRAWLRPREGYVNADLPPGAYDAMAPERITEGREASPAADWYAFGCLAWQLLTGRPPHTGGDAIARLRAAHRVNFSKLAELVPDIPQLLAELVAACTQPDPAGRLARLEPILAALGPADTADQRRIARLLHDEHHREVWFGRLPASPSVPAAAAGETVLPWVLAAAAGCLAFAATLWPLWQQSGAIPSPSPAVVERLESPPAAAEQSEGVARLSRPEAPASRSPSQVPGTMRPAEGEPAGTVALVGFERPVAENRLLLPHDRPTPVEQIELLPGQTITAAAGERATLLLTGGPLRIPFGGIRFERIDFLYERATTPDTSPREPTLLELTGERLELQDCRFAVRGASTPAATAICWRNSGDEQEPSLLPAGRLTLSGVTFQGMSTAVAVEREGTLLVEARRVLHTGPGSLIQLPQLPGPDAALRVRLEQCTIRSAAVCHATVSEERRAGTLQFEAWLSVFDPGPHHAVVEVAGPETAGEDLRHFRWSGDGSLLAAEAEFLGLDHEGVIQPLADSGLAVSGLVRSRLRFAGAASDSIADSRLLEWLAPLPSGARPGFQDWR